MPVCADCQWFSEGNPNGGSAGYCYSEGDYVDPDGHCDFWEARHRINALTGDKFSDLDEPPGKGEV